jgi:hypothetical protein
MDESIATMGGSAMRSSVSSDLMVADTVIVSLFGLELVLKMAYLRAHFLHHAGEVVDLLLVTGTLTVCVESLMHPAGYLSRWWSLIVVTRVWRVVTLVNTCSKRRAARAKFGLVRKVSQLKAQNQALIRNAAAAAAAGAVAPFSGLAVGANAAPGAAAALQPSAPPRSPRRPSASQSVAHGFPKLTLPPADFDSEAGFRPV